MLLLARSLIFGWTLVGLLLAIRGGLTAPSPAPGWQIVLATLLLLGCASLMRIAGGVLSPGRSSHWRSAALGPLPGMALLAYWLVMLSQNMATASLVVVLVAVHEGSWLLGALYYLTSSRASHGDVARRTLLASEPASDSGSSDLMLRRGGVEGAEQIHGTARLRFQPGQRTASMPIGFSPPLVPDCRVEAETVEGVEVALKIIDPSAVGFTLEARRAGGIGEGGEAVVEFFAVPHPATITDPRLLAAE